MMGQEIRQYIPFSNGTVFSDISSDQNLMVQSVTTKGAALRDRFQADNGVMLPAASGQFNPDGTVSRSDLAYSMVQSLGLQSNALALNGTQINAHYNGQDIAVDDASSIPAGMEGYVQLAIDLNLINVYFSLEQGPYDLQPTMHANFHPLNNVTRGDFAVIVTRTFTQWQTPDPSLGKSNGEQDVSISQPLTYGLQQNYPNPFNPSTVINYSIPAAGLVTLDVFNVLGQKVATLVNDVKPAGIYSVSFDASKLASGVYIYRISADNYVKTMKMALMK
jgi:serine protease AprX